MIRGLPTTILSVLLAGAVGIGLFFVKHEVKEQEARLSELNREIERSQEAIHVLKAEWSYLNDPSRLRNLSEKFLSMKVMGAAQVASLDHLPAMEPASGPAYAQAEQPRPAVKLAAAIPAPSPAQAQAAKAPQPVKLAAAKPAVAPTSVANVAPAAIARPAAATPSRTAVAVAPQLQPPPAAPARRSIVIQSPALAATPGLPGAAAMPGEVR